MRQVSIVKFVISTCLYTTHHVLPLCLSKASFGGTKFDGRSWKYQINIQIPNTRGICWSAQNYSTVKINQEANCGDYIQLFTILESGVRRFHFTAEKNIPRREPLFHHPHFPTRIHYPAILFPPGFTIPPLIFRIRPQGKRTWKLFMLTSSLHTVHILTPTWNAKLV